MRSRAKQGQAGRDRENCSRRGWVNGKPRDQVITRPGFIRLTNWQTTQWERAGCPADRYRFAKLERRQDAHS